MAELGFKIISSKGEVLQEKKATDEIFFVYKDEYKVPGRSFLPCKIRN